MRATMEAQSFWNSQDQLVIAAVAGIAFLLILWAVIALRVKRDVEVRLADILVAVAPIILVLLASDCNGEDRYQQRQAQP